MLFSFLLSQMTSLSSALRDWHVFVRMKGRFLLCMRNICREFSVEGLQLENQHYCFGFNVEILHVISGIIFHFLNVFFFFSC